MLRRIIKTKILAAAACMLAVAILAIPATTRSSEAKTNLLTASTLAQALLATVPPVPVDDLTGRELLSVTRVAQGGAEYAGLQYVTARSNGFVNATAFAAVGAAALAAAVEVKVGVTDYQDRDLRRRLDINPTGGLVLGPTFLVYTGTTGGGMLAGNEIRVSEVAASRQWAMMGFGTLNRAIDGQLTTVRQPDQPGQYVVEVKFSPQDTVRYYISKNNFLINKVTTRYNSQVLVEEDRSDYRRVSCMLLPFRIVTKLRGQRLADLTIDNYDLQTVVPAARFTLTATPTE